MCAKRKWWFRNDALMYGVASARYLVYTRERTVTVEYNTILGKFLQQ